jgi:hypothetical protein
VPAVGIMIAPKESSAVNPVSHSTSAGKLADRWSPRRPLRSWTLAPLLTLAGLLGTLVFCVTPALAAAPEVPETKAASAVGYTTATLNGVLNPKNVGEAGEYQFTYGTGGVCTEASTEPVIALGFKEEAVEANVTGLAPNTQYTFCLLERNVEGEAVSAEPDLTFTTKVVTAPTVTIDPVSTFTATTAHFSGKVDPNAPGPEPQDPAFNSAWHFECTPECPGLTGGEVAADNSSHEVTAETTGLLPNETYKVTLVASNLGGTAVGPAVSFTTGAEAPSIEAEATVGVTATSAELTAQINPNGTATSYQFEYGTTTGYGLSVPVVPAAIGASRAGVKVSAVLNELKATTYHWRLVASNTAGETTDGPDETFVYPAGGGLSDGRGYELVTPPQKNGAIISAEFGNGGRRILPQVAEDGQALLAVSIQCFDGPASCTAVREQEGEPYEFARTPTGWVTRPLAPSATQFSVNSIWALNATEHTVLFSAPPSPGIPDEWYALAGTGEITGIGPVGETGNTFQKLGRIVATGDLSHIVFQGRELWTFGGLFENKASSYEYVGVGNARPLLVGVTGDEGSGELISDGASGSSCGTELGGGLTTADQYGAMSGSGRTVYFKADGGAGCVGTGAVNEHVAVPVDELFARVDGEGGEAHTVALSEPQALTQGAREECETAGCVTNTEVQAGPTGNPSWREAFFQGASSDGTRMFFTSEQQLTDQASQDEGNNLYESECVEACETKREVRRLVDVSGAQGGGAAAGGPRVQGVVAISPQAGTHVYFIAESALTGSEENQNHEHAEDGKDNLYLYERDPAHPTGHRVFIGKLLPADAPDWNEGVGQANVTPEGRFLVFESAAALTADDTRPGGPAQIYRYDAQTNTLIRVSIGQNGFDDNGNLGSGNAQIVSALHGFPLVGQVRADPTMSHNGEYVFFQSPNALASGALNDVPTGGEARGHKLLAQNVYEYHDGNVYLVSDGRDVTEKTPTVAGIGELIGSDATGANVFFETNDPLVPEDTDTQLDYYDAHLCSEAEPCIPPAAPAAPCEGENCQGTPSTAPSFQTPGSTALSGSDNLAPPPPAVVKPKTAAQIKAEKLAKALKACHKYKKKSKRKACEKQAKRKYGAAKAAKRKK